MFLYLFLIRLNYLPYNNEDKITGSLYTGNTFSNIYYSIIVLYWQIGFIYKSLVDKKMSDRFEICMFILKAEG